jgi:hypothetical protein
MYGLLDPQDKWGQLGLLLTQVGGGIGAAGGQGLTGIGQIGAGIGQGMQGFAQAQQANQMAQYRAQQIASEKRRQEQEELVRQAQARIANRLTSPGGSMARNPQMVSAAPGASAGAPPFDMTQAMKDPAFLQDVIAASGGDPLKAMAILQKDEKPITVAPGAALVDPRTYQPRYVNPRSERPTELDKLFDAAGIPEGDPRRAQLATQILERKGQPMSVKVDNIGNIPPGYELVTTPEGAKRMQQIPGSPVAEAAAKTQKQQSQAGNLVIQDIDRAQQIIEKSMLPTTGVVGGWLSKVGGTDARDLRGLLDTVRANAGFKELQAMRDSSPTGGALGQVTERELALLQAVVGNLEQDQSKEQLVDNMRRVKNVYLDIIHGPGNGPARAKLKFAEPEAPKADAGNPYAKMTDQQILEELRKQGLLK